VSGAAIYPGSFDPVTLGHLDVIRRAAGVFEHVTVAVVGNPSKQPMFSAAERVAFIAAELARPTAAGAAADPRADLTRRVDVVAFDGLLVDLCAQLGVRTVVKGLRGVGDLEVELRMAQMNRQVGDVETVFLATAPEHSHLASSFVREIAAFGGRLTGTVPLAVEEALRERARR
jgi:pantetheine-phosphate adenylyltransferase